MTPDKTYCMPKKLLFFAAVILLLFVISCQKSNNKTNTNELEGNWAFVSSQIQQVTQNKQVGPGVDTLAVDSFNYVTTNNTGSVSFTADSVITKGLGYLVSTTHYQFGYNHGQLTHSVSGAYTMTIPPGNVSNSYLYIQKDSIYCPIMTFCAQTSVGTLPSAPGGSGYVLNGDMLVITTITGTNVGSTQSGVTYTTSDTARVVTTLHRQ